MSGATGSQAPPESGNPWPQRVKDRWFLSVLAVSVLAVAALFSPFLYVLLIASVVVVVAWPLFERVLDACGGRRGIASALTVLLLAVVLGVPLGVLVYLFVAQAISMVGVAVDYIQSGALSEQFAALSRSTDWMPSWLQRWLPTDFDLQQTVAGPLQERVLWALGAMGAAIPSLIGGTMSAGVDLAIFLLTVATLFVEGPRLLRALSNLSPLDDVHEARLFSTFRAFANSVVVGTVATALVQGTVAGVGYAIAGVDRVVFFAMLTGCFSLVPVVGTLVIWAPLAVVTGVEHGLGWGLFLGGWGVMVTQLDNVVRPLFMRGRTNVHPLLVFLGVFGGLAWMGVPGVLVGPVVVVLFLALYTIYLEHYLGLTAPVASPPVGPDRAEGGVRRALRRLGRRRPRRLPPTPGPDLGEPTSAGPPGG